jgi:alpha-tubulin suppressor-like RCC1 family protein
MSSSTIVSSNGYLRVAGNYFSSFTRVTAISGITSIACGTGHQLALRSDGTVYATGDNSRGQLGLGDSMGRLTFAAVPGISFASAVAAGGSTSFFVERDSGRLYGCGANLNGQLGTNDSMDRSSFVQTGTFVSATYTYIGVACGYQHAVGLRSDGTLATTGLNKDGQLGSSSTVDRQVFNHISMGGSYIAVAAGYAHTVALRHDGYVLGSGMSSGVGAGSINRSSFVQALGVSNVLAIAAGYKATLALRGDGQVYGTGINLSGQLGIGALGSSQITFVPLTGLTKIVAVALGGSSASNCSSLALREDGAVFAAGANATGKLGDGLTAGSRTVFVQVSGFWLD